LVVEFAELADRPTTPEAIVEWAEIYGLLGFPDTDVVSVDAGFMIFNVKGQGRRDSVTRFATAVREVSACLRLYEVATAPEMDPSVVEIYAECLPLKARRPWEHSANQQDRRRVLRMVGRTVQTRVVEGCHPQLQLTSAGTFTFGWGFRNLLGAIWLQMAWLLATGEDAPRCRLLDCDRIITFEPSEAPIEPGLKKNARGKYKTRSDRVFCKDRPCKQKYHYRKKAGWPNYV
jgi:hypothetical protein